MIIIIYSKLTQELNRLDHSLSELQNTIEKLPPGNICCAHNGNKTKWYLSNGKKSIYLPKSNRHLAEQLAYKKYLQTLHQELSSKRSALSLCCKQYESISNKSSTMISSDSAYHDLLSPYFENSAQDLHQWAHQPYDSNTKHPEQLTHKTIAGHFVRSKSEALIDMLLFVNKIPYRYESILSFDTFFFYPDFTIRHPDTHQFYYWEHFGRMDDPSYRRNVFSKLQTYASYGIIPSINLITTYETKDHPLTADTVNKIIHEYFL